MLDREPRFQLSPGSPASPLSEKGSFLEPRTATQVEDGDPVVNAKRCPSGLRSQPLPACSAIKTQPMLGSPNRAPPTFPRKQPGGFAANLPRWDGTEPDWGLAVDVLVRAADVDDRVRAR